MHRLQPIISICKTHGARGRGAIVRRRRRAATAALSADMDMVRRVGSSGGGGVWTWVWKLAAATRGQIVTTAQVTRQTRYSNTLVCQTPLAYTHTHKEDLPRLALTLG
ncbi:hypothetical protein Q7P35_010727 [Cladosporium inversicolor]